MFSTMLVMVNSNDCGMTQAVAIAALKKRTTTQTGTFEEILFDRRYGGFDQVRPIVDRPRDEVFSASQHQRRHCDVPIRRHRPGKNADGAHSNFRTSACRPAGSSPLPWPASLPTPRPGCWPSRVPCRAPCSEPSGRRFKFKDSDPKGSEFSRPTSPWAGADRAFCRHAPAPAQVRPIRGLGHFRTGARALCRSGRTPCGRSS